MDVVCEYPSVFWKLKNEAPSKCRNRPDHRLTVDRVREAARGENFTARGFPVWVGLPFTPAYSTTPFTGIPVSAAAGSPQSG